MLLKCSAGEDSWESLGLQGDQTSQSQRKSTLNIHWKDWCWSWSSNTLATWCEEMTYWKRPWCWERLKAGEGGDRGWDGWMASLTQWTWVWVNSGSWWWTGRPGVLQSMGSPRAGHDWATELNWILGRVFQRTKWDDLMITWIYTKQVGSRSTYMEGKKGIQAMMLWHLPDQSKCWREFEEYFYK